MLTINGGWGTMDAHTIICETLRALLQATSHPLFQKITQNATEQKFFSATADVEGLMTGDLVTTSM